jgi:hypothetical protein
MKFDSDTAYMVHTAFFLNITLHLVGYKEHTRMWSNVIIHLPLELKRMIIFIFSQKFLYEI